MMDTFSSEWQEAALAEVAAIVRDVVEPTRIASGTRYVGLEHLDGDGNFLNISEVASGDLASAKFRFDPDHILYGKLRPYLRKIARPDFNGICSTDILPIKPVSRQVSRDYLYHYLRLPQMVNLANTRTTGANLPRLSPTTLAEFPVRFPPLDEQRRIAAILDKADAIRRRRRQALAEIDNLLRATFLDMFGDTLTNLLGWPVRELREVVDPARPITYGIVQAGPHVEGGIPYIRTSDFDGHSLRSSGYGMTSPDIAARFQRSEVRTGDLVFCIRASVGSVARVPDFLNGANLTQGTALIAPGPAVEPDYLLNTLQQNGTQAWIQTRQKGATFKEITLAALRETPIPMPPKNLQQRFASFYIRTSDRRSRLRELNMEADALFSALSQRAFRGEL